MLDQIKYEEIASILRACDKQIIGSSRKNSSSIVVHSVSTNYTKGRRWHKPFRILSASELAEFQKGYICRASSGKRSMAWRYRLPQN